MVKRIKTKEEIEELVKALNEGYTIRHVFFNEPDRSFSHQVLFYLLKGYPSIGCNAVNSTRANIPENHPVAVCEYVQSVFTRKSLSFFEADDKFFAPNMEYFLKPVGDMVGFRAYLANAGVSFFEILQTPADAGTTPVHPDATSQSQAR